MTDCKPCTISITDCGGKYYFDAAEADRVCEFFERFLVHFEGEFAGKAFKLLPWQRDYVVRPLFGWRRASDGTRRFRKLILFVPRKNGKTSLAAGLALVLLFADREPGALIYSAASDRKQASIAFDAARHMMTPELLKRCKVYRRAITVPSTLSTYHVLSADARSAHGGNPHGLILDELHAWRTRDLYDALSTGRAARRQPVTIEITTAGDNPESICAEEYDYARRVISGAISDEQTLPVIFEADQAADWRKPETWAAANPSLGVTVKPEYIEAECAAAIADVRKQAAFRRLHLNQWTQQTTAWIDLHDWDACDEPLDVASLEGQPCWVGIDLSTKQDLTCVALVFRYDDGSTGTLNYKISILPYFYIPEDTMLRNERRDNVPYSLWAQQGFVIPTPGNIVDYSRIFDDLQTLSRRFKIIEVGYDPWNASQFALQLQEAGFRIVEVRQGAQTMSEPSKTFEALIRARRIRHGGNPVLRWNVSNVTAREDKKGNIFPHKQKSTQRIDGVIATIIGLSRMLVAAPQRKQSIYSTRELRVLGLD